MADDINTNEPIIQGFMQEIGRHIVFYHARNEGFSAQIRYRTGGSSFFWGKTLEDAEIRARENIADHEKIYGAEIVLKQARATIDDLQKQLAKLKD